MLPTGEIFIVVEMANITLVVKKLQKVKTKNCETQLAFFHLRT